LSIFLGRTKATAWAVFLGQTLAIGFFIYAFLPLGLDLLPEEAPIRDIIDWPFQPVLMFISLFVIYTARNEYSQVLLEQEMNEKTVADLMSTIFVRFQTIDAMHTAIKKCSESVVKDFLVFDDAQILRGVLQEADINDAQKNGHFEAMVSTYTTVNFQSARPTDSIKSIYDRMIKAEQSLFPVLNTEGAVVGVVDFEMMENFMKK
jgi:predicted transcriptional regulator